MVNEGQQMVLGIVTGMVWCLTLMRVPAALVPIRDQVLIPLMNYGMMVVSVDEIQPITLLDEVAELSEEIAWNERGVVRSIKPRMEPLRDPWSS